ncbi:MAG: MFS transporter [Candidatus Thorarchaeota archaeon]
MQEERSSMDRATISVYFTYAMQATAQAISWQFVTFFVKHDLNAPGFLELTIIWSLPAIVVMVMSNFWGWLSDRLRRRKVFMLIGFTGYAVTFLLYSFVSTSTQYLLIAVVGAVFYSSALPAGQAHLTTATDKKGERLGYFVAAQSGGWFLGAFMSGLLYDHIGMFTLYRIAAIMSIVAMVSCLVLIRDIPFLPRDETLAKTGFGELLRRPGMSRLTLAVTLSQIGMNSVAFLLAIILVDELAGTTTFVGMANSAATIVALLTTGLIGKIVDRRGPVKILIVAYLSYTLFAAAFAMVTSPIIATILWALPIYPFSSTATTALAALISGEDERGRAMALVYGAQNAGGAIGPVVGGLLAEYVFFMAQPISWLNMICNLMALALAVSLLRVGKRRHAERVATASSEV